MYGVTLIPFYMQYNSGNGVYMQSLADAASFRRGGS